MPQQTSSGAPVLAPTASVDGAALTSPQAVYQGFRAQRRELGQQQDELQGKRDELSSQLQRPAITGADRIGLESRIADVDSRISAVGKQITDADAQVAKAAGVPGAAIEPPEPPRTGVPDEAWELGGMFIVIVFLPLSIAFARRIWKRGGQVIAAFPKEVSDRLMRVEQAVEATAIEVERIGEGQRFMTKVLTENASPALSLDAGQPSAVRASQPAEIRR